MTIQRFMIDNYGPSEDNLRLFFQQSFNYAKEQDIKNIAFFVASKKSFEGGVVAKFLGDDVVKKLSRQNEYQDPSSGITYSLVTPRTLSLSKNYGMVLAFYLSIKDLDQIDSIRNAETIAYISWSKDEAKYWFSIWNPTIWGNSDLSFSQENIPELAVQQLVNLTHRINLTTGLMHPSDKQAAIEIFKILRGKKIFLSSEIVKQWAVRNGWEPSHANQLAKLAEQYCR